MNEQEEKKLNKKRNKEDKEPLISGTMILSLIAYALAFLSLGIRIGANFF